MNTSLISRNCAPLRHWLAALVAGTTFIGSLTSVLAQAPSISISPDVPSDITTLAFTGMIGAPGGPGGAPSASPEDASKFAWQEFIALNWPSSFYKDKKRGWPDKQLRFGEPKPNYDGPTVWQTFRGKVEIFPGQGMPPGYPGTGPDDPSKGFDAPPAYHYSADVPPCEKPDPNATPTTPPFINLDEVDQITLDYMFAGVVDPSSSKGNSAPQLIRFMAKANEAEYAYVARNGWWNSVPDPIRVATRNYLATNRKSPDAGSSNYVSLPYGTIETKAAWRPLNDSELNSGRFHTQLVRFYEQSQGALCYRDAIWGLVALHIIQKTPSAPYFIYASFEQSDNLLTEDGKYVEDTDGKVILPAPQTATTPQVCLIDPSPQPPTLRPPVPDMPSSMGRVVLTDDPATCIPSEQQVPACSPGKRLYYINEFGAAPRIPDNKTDSPPVGNICVNKRDNEIPQYAIDANKEAHSVMKAYFEKENISSSPWLYYKLVNVQYYPYDKFITNPAPNGSLYDSSPPYTAKNPARSNFYMANIVVETNRALQLFSGGLSPSISTDWNEDRSGHKNTYYGGNFYSAGGCLGCHGSQGQIPGLLTGKPLAGDFSVILARGSVASPEAPDFSAFRPPAAAALQGEAAPRMLYIRNRSLKE